LLLVTLGLLAGIIVDRAASKSTNAQQADRNQSDKWEYAVISDLSWDSHRKTYSARICYFRTSGCHDDDIEAPPSEGDAGDRVTIKTLAKASATLGESGWEMIGEAPTGQFGNARLYFKRRQR